MEHELNITSCIVYMHREQPLLKSLNIKMFKAMVLKDFRSDRELTIRYDLNAKGDLIAKEVVSKGTIISNPVHSREFFKGAILNNAAVCIMAHNHPSGALVPSTADIITASMVHTGGLILGIPVVDFILVNGSKFVSYIGRIKTPVGIRIPKTWFTKGGDDAKKERPHKKEKL